jgi:hypothetical protein
MERKEVSACPIRLQQRLGLPDAFKMSKLGELTHAVALPPLNV